MSSVVEMVFGSIIVGLNTISIVILIVIIIKPKTNRNAYIYQMNLAIADCGVGGYLIAKNLVDMDRKTCTFVIGTGLTALFASLSTITMSAVDRFFFLFHEVYYEVWFNEIRTIALLLAIWALSALFGYVPLKWSRLRKPKCNVLTESYKMSPLFRSTTGLFLICLVLFVGGTVVYRQLHDYPTTRLPRFVYTRSRFSYGWVSKAYLISKSVMFGTALIVLWLPNIVVSIYYDLFDNENENLEYLLTVPLLYMVYFNSVVNPIFYEWCHYGFYSFVFQKCMYTAQMDNHSVRSFSARHISQF